MTVLGPPVLVGVSLKMYFDADRTKEWCRAVAEIARRHEALLAGRVSLFVLPSMLSLQSAIDIFSETSVAVGAQNLFWEDRGAYTGEVSGLDLRDLGCALVEIGHAERRGLLGEDDSMVNRKLVAAMRNSLIPVLCIGEHEVGSVTDAASACIRQLESALDSVLDGPVVVAYEPTWAIGAEHPASVGYVAEVVERIRDWLSALPGRAGSRIMYGGSAGPGLLRELGGAIDGLFLGRFAHDPVSLESVLDEAAELPSARALTESVATVKGRQWPTRGSNL